MAAPILRRALLYVPGSSKRMLEKSRGLDVDCITYDLEDSVTASQKPTARSQVREALSQPRARGVREQTVRINAVSSGIALDDLNEVLKAPYIDAIVIPKVDKPSDITYVSQVLATATAAAANRSPIKLIALIESARAIMDIRSICAAEPSRLSGLIFAAEDFSLDLSITRTPGLREFLFARQTIVAAARAYGLDSAIDLVCTDYKDTGPDGPLARECEDGAGMGFTGKQVIHPTQVDVVQRMFSPREDRVKGAVRLLAAERRAEELGKGSWTLDGKMVDRPVIEAAKRIVEKAELAGMDVETWRAQFRDTQPE